MLDSFKIKLLASIIVGTVIASMVVVYTKFNQNQDWRLIQFSEAETKWMTQEEVEEMAVECGAGRHHRGGFFDITDHPNFSPAGLKVHIPRDFPNPRFQTFIRPLLTGIEKQNLIDNLNALSAFHTRYYTTNTGRAAAELIYATFEKYANGRSDVTVSLFEHSWVQPSVIARVTGKIRPDIVIVVGAHEDSINGGGVNRAPGADDDASGVVTALETFRILMESGWEPEISVEFMTYAAEEIGLRGSADIANSYQNQQTEVYAVMQLDMTMYKGSSGRMGIIRDFVDNDLATFTTKIVDIYADIGWADVTCGYACSDHASWTRAGYASCSPFESLVEEMNNRIHTSQDLITFLDMDHGVQFVKVAVAWVVELAGIANINYPK